MTDKQLRAGTVVVHDGWIISSDPNGGTQFDTGLCGSALLDASELHAKREWKLAGLRAAEWALRQSCCANFNYNAFSVSLLCHAYRVTNDVKYLDAEAVGNYFPTRVTRSSAAQADPWFRG